MIIDGVTWACTSCTRGHRAVQCQHIERDLQPLAKKGRPVSQCHHCRSLRNSRSLHTNCKCELMLRNGEQHKMKCRCFEDGNCVCGFKKETNTAKKASKTGTPPKADEVAVPSPSLDVEHMVLETTPQPQFSPSDMGYIETNGIDYSDIMNGLNSNFATENYGLPSTGVEDVNWGATWESFPKIQATAGSYTDLLTDPLAMEFSDLVEVPDRNSGTGCCGGTSHGT